MPRVRRTASIQSFIRWLCALALLCFGVVSIPRWAGASAAAQPQVLQLDRGTLLIEQTLSAPPSAADPRWAPVELPDSWRETRPGQAGLGWYRFRIARPADLNQRWALYLPSVNMTADAYVNGAPVGSGGPLSGEVARNFAGPLYFVFPGSLLDRDQNDIDIVIAAVAHNYASLAPVSLGPDAVLAPRHDRDHFVRRTLPWLETFLSLAMAGLMLALWRSSRDRVYGTFAAVCTLYAVASLNYWVRSPPFDTWTWERIVQLSLVNFATTLAVWSRYVVGLHATRPVRALLGTGLALAVVILLLPVSWFLPVIRWLHLFTFAMAAYACLAFVLSIRRLGAGEKALFGAGGLLGLFLGAHDIAINLGWLGPDSTYLMPHEIPLFVLTFGISLVRRFTHSLRAAEDMSRVLEQRVEEKRREIEEGYRTRRALEHEKLLSTERDRMIREMHDGLGSQLTSALALIERGRGDPARISAALRGALDEMRLVINSLDSEPREIAEVLGALRPRLQPVFDGHGVQLVWRIEDLPAQRRFGAEESLHVLRIVQEAITNSLKHGQATRIEVHAAQGGSAVFVSVSDNGQGFQPDGVKLGRGLLHMQQRARSLGGQLLVSRNQPGTTIRLELPIEPPTGAPASGPSAKHAALTELQ